MLDQQPALTQLRMQVMADEKLQRHLSQEEDPARFAEIASRSAEELGLGSVAEAINSALAPDPLGLARWNRDTLAGSDWPPAHWLPIHVTPTGDTISVEWAYFGAAPLTDPFFESSIRKALRSPFGRLFRYGTTLPAFLQGAASDASLTPTGFIFHMSRCGSTLVAQMLAALPGTLVVSEAPPIDAMVQVARAIPEDMGVRALQAMVSAYGRPRSGHERHYVIKLDSWHAMALPLFRRAFPGVPFVFLYRDPLEVLVSQMLERGMQTVAEFVSPSFYGIDASEHMSAEDYCARVLGAVCQAAMDHGGGGLFINYRQLPEAVWTTILPHFAIVGGEPAVEAMQQVAQRNAKSPTLRFADDSDAKRHAATPAIRAAADRLQDIYRQLEGLRACPSTIDRV
jgi:hypothetical protein